MINGIPDPIFVKNRQHQWILLNDAFCNFIGHSREELIGKSDYDLLPKAEADVFWETDELVFTTGMTDEKEEFFTDSYGVTHFILTKKCLFEDEQGDHFLVGTIRNFTQQKRVEAELAEKACLAALHVEINTAITQGQTLQPILKHCTDALVNHVNAAFARIWTLNTQDNVLELQASSGMYTHINGPHGRVPVGMFKIGLIAQERQPHLTNNVLDDPRVGNQEWAKQEGMVAFAGYPLILDGNLMGVIAMFARQTLTQSALDALQLAANEISLGIKRIQAEQALKESEKKYRHLVEASQNMIWSVDAQGCLTFVNQAVRSIYGYEPAEMIGRHCIEFEPPEQIQQPGILPSILAGESVFQYDAVVLAKDGRKLNLLCNTMVLRDEAGSVLGKIGTATNITELKRAEAALQRSNAVLQAQQEASIDGILLIDENGEIASYNQHFSHLWQISPSILQTADDQQLLGYVLDQLEHPAEFLAKIEYLYQHSDESSRDEIVLRDGRTFDRYSAPVRSKAGDYYGRIWYFRDITERKQTLSDLRQQAQELEIALHKLQHTQAQLIQSEKMSSLGQLVAGVAHEINNPVNFIYGNLNPADEYTKNLLSLLDLYRKHYPQPETAIEEFADIIDLEFLRSDLPKLFKSMKIGAERIRAIVLSLRTFSRLDEAEMKAVDIHEGIDSTLMIIQGRLKSTDLRPTIEVIKEYGDLPLIECYAGQLNQVFMNILANAIDALEDSFVRGRWATKKQLKTDNPRIYIRTQLPAPNQVVIRIADNGLGIPEDIKDQLFNPFFTTKPVGKGTGMGLAISYQIITERHNGSLECISQPGVGAEFVVRIPLIQERQTSHAIEVGSPRG